MKVLTAILGLTIGILIVIGIPTLIYWGIGNLIIHVFEINYTWTILHGLCTALVTSALHSIFTNNK